MVNIRNVQTNKAGIITLVLAVFLIAAVGYIGVGAYNNSQTEKMNTITANAVNYGVQSTSAQIYLATANCQVVTVNTMDAESNPLQRQLIDIECIKAAAPVEE